MDTAGHGECDPAFLTVFGHVRRGIKSVVSVAQPAAGADWSQVVPGGEQWRVLAGQSLFTTAAAVANRTPRIRITDGTSPFFEAIAATQVTAGVAATISIQRDVAAAPATNGIWALILGVPTLWLPSGYVIRSITDGIQAADQYSNVRLYVERAYETDTDLTDEYYRRLKREQRT